MGVYSDNYSDSEMSGNSYQYGYDYSNLISLEINYSSPDVTGTTASAITMDSLSSVMLRINNRYESINTYFMIGAAHIMYSTLSPVADVAETGLSYGVGIELYGSKNTAISFTWSTTEFETGSQVESLDTTRIGLIHHFDFGQKVSRY